MEHLLFTRDFDAEIDAERRLATTVSPTYSAEALAEAVAAARQQGLDEGRALGLDEGRAEMAAALAARHAEALERLLPEVSALLADRAAHRHGIETEMAAYVRDVAEAVLPEIVQSIGQKRIDTEIHRLIRCALGSPTLEIRLSPVVAETMAADLATLEKRATPAIRVIPDGTLEPAEVTARWRDGHARYSFAAICRSILAAVADVSPPPPLQAQAGPEHA